MARRRKGANVHGWLALDKPAGLTSTQALSRAQRLFDARKAGHGGTLDPLATGLLPIAFGEATKTSAYMMDGFKTYSFQVRWGAETDSCDSEGSVVRTGDARPSLAEIEAVLPEFVGLIQQTPPIFSAIKVDGRRAYDLARNGDPVELAPRQVEVERLELLGRPDDDTAEFECDCGKGTYVRSLARDLGRRLDVLGHVVALRRTAVGPFTEDDMISLASLEEIGHGAAGSADRLDLLCPVETALDDIPALAIGRDDAARLRSGQSIILRGRDAPILSGPAFAMCHGVLVALGEVRRGAFGPSRVFNLTA